VAGVRDGCGIQIIRDNTPGGFSSGDVVREGPPIARSIASSVRSDDIYVGMIDRGDCHDTIS